MSCLRCKGFTVREYLVDLREGSLWGVFGWRCVNCGAIGDTLIQSNPKKPSACTRRRPRLPLTPPLFFATRGDKAG